MYVVSIYCIYDNNTIVTQWNTKYWNDWCCRFDIINVRYTIFIIWEVIVWMKMRNVFSWTGRKYLLWVSPVIHHYESLLSGPIIPPKGHYINWPDETRRIRTRRAQTLPTSHGSQLPIVIFFLRSCNIFIE
jgi:hypothetical protein